MSLLSRASRIQNRFLDAIRHPAAFEVARKEPNGADFSTFKGSRQCLLITFKRSGEPVPSPVNFGLSDDGKLYVRCEPEVAKVKRIRNDPHVRVVPCSFRGKPCGDLVDAVARIVPDGERQRAHELIAANWDPVSRIFERSVDRLKVPVVYIEIAPRL
jgi:PPOX class probable F420-dependent enzyme